MRVPLLLYALLLGLSAAGQRQKEEVRLVFGDPEAGGAAREEVEFLEDVAGQNYLDVVTFRDRFVLDLLKFSDEIRNSKTDTNPDNAYLCPRQLLENFGLRGVATPLVRAVPPRYCPAMKQSCCLPSDLEDLERVWREKYGPKVQYVQHYTKFYLKDLLAHFPDFAAAAEVIARDHKRAFCRDAAGLLLASPVTAEQAAEFVRALDAFFEFDARLKRGFMCLLCDYENLGALDPEAQLQAFHRDSCHRLVDGTFDFQFAAHRWVYRLVNTVSVLAGCQRSMAPGFNETEGGAPPFLQVEDARDLEVCHFARQRGYNVFVNCLSYCSRYRLWRPEAPTYPSLETLARIHQAAKDALFVDREGLTVTPPKNAEVGVIVPSKRDRLDLLTTWEVVFADAAGVRFAHLADPSAADF